MAKMATTEFAAHGATTTPAAMETMSPPSARARGVADICTIIGAFLFYPRRLPRLRGIYRGKSLACNALPCAATDRLICKIW